MKKLLGMLAAVAVIGLAGCGADTPDAVALKFMEASSAGNIEKVCSYASKDTAKGIQGMIEVVGKEKFREQLMEYKDVSFKAVETKITGDKARVKVEGKKGTRTVSETLNLIKEDGEWKLNIGD